MSVAKDLGATVIATTRQPDRVEALMSQGVDHVVVDTGTVADEVRRIVPDGVHAALELVGTPTLQDTLRSTRVHRTVCFTGMLSNQWVVPDFYLIEYLPRGVRLTAYGGGSADLPSEVLQNYLDRLAAGTIDAGPTQVHRFDEIRSAHSDMEHNRTFGKHVVLTDPGHRVLHHLSTRSEHASSVGWCPTATGPGPSMPWDQASPKTGSAPLPGVARFPHASPPCFH